MQTVKLDNEPRHHPDCCLALSLPLIDILISHVPSNSHILSIGSGTGLLEHLINNHGPRNSSLEAKVRGVEVLTAAGSPNRYLPEELLFCVVGTRTLLPAAAEAQSWMFVYPRESRLVEQYIQVYGAPGAWVRKIIWLGPRCDWEDYRPMLELWSGSKVNEFRGADCGIADYEVMGLAEREVP